MTVINCLPALTSPSASSQNSQSDLFKIPSHWSNRMMAFHHSSFSSLTEIYPLYLGTIPRCSRSRLLHLLIFSRHTRRWYLSSLSLFSISLSVWPLFLNCQPALLHTLLSFSQSTFWWFGKPRRFYQGKTVRFFREINVISSSVHFYSTSFYTALSKSWFLLTYSL